MLLQLQADAYGRLGKPAQGLEVLDQVFAIIGVDNEEIVAAEIYRRKGDLLLVDSQEHAPEAEAFFCGL